MSTSNPRHLAALALAAGSASSAFPKMPLDAALQFADEKQTKGGIMTQAALDTLASELRRIIVRLEKITAAAERQGKHAESVSMKYQRQRSRALLSALPNKANIPTCPE